jgi:hypothetical protein
MTMDTQVNLKEYSKPLTKFKAMSFKFVYTKSQKITNFNLQNQTIFTDSGLIFSNTKFENFIKLFEQQTDLSDINDTNEGPVDKNMIVMSFYPSNKSDVYNRKYINLPQILASTGGAVQIFLLVFSFLNSKIDSVRKYENIINQIFYINKLNQNNIGHQGMIMNSSNLRAPHNTSNLKMNFEVSNNILFQDNKSKLGESQNSQFVASNNYFDFSGHTGDKSSKILGEKKSSEDIINRIRSLQSKKLELARSEKFRLYMHPLIYPKKWISPNLELYVKAYKRIKSYFNLVNIIKKLEQFEKLKDLLFQDQKEIFNIISKPSIIESFEHSGNNFDFVRLETNLKSIYPKQNGKYDLTKIMKNMLMRLE